MTEKVYDLFTSSGILRKQLGEFWGVNLADYLDKRQKPVVLFNDDTSLAILVQGVGGEATVHIEADVDRVVGYVTWSDFDEHTNAFKCYQKPHLALFYRSLIKVAQMHPQHIHPEFII